MQENYKQYLLGLDKLFNETGLTVVESVEAAGLIFDPEFGAPLVCFNGETNKHALFTEEGIEYP